VGAFVPSLLVLGISPIPSRASSADLNLLNQLKARYIQLTSMSPLELIKNEKEIVDLIAQHETFFHMDISQNDAKSIKSQALWLCARYQIKLMDILVYKELLPNIESTRSAIASYFTWAVNSNRIMSASYLQTLDHFEKIKIETLKHLQELLDLKEFDQISEEIVKNTLEEIEGLPTWDEVLQTAKAHLDLLRKAKLNIDDSVLVELCFVIQFHRKQWIKEGRRIKHLNHTIHFLSDKIYVVFERKSVINLAQMETITVEYDTGRLMRNFL
jgi:hypothetical protein